MPFAFILIGLALVISAVRGTHGDLAKLLKKDFTGENNFFVWMIAIGVIGLVGYNQKASTFSRYAMALVLLAMILANGGVFDKLSSAIREMGDEGSNGGGAAGNTLAPTGGSSTAPAATSGTTAERTYTRDSPEVQAIGKNIDKIGSVATNVVQGADKIMKSIPILGSFF